MKRKSSQVKSSQIKIIILKSWHDSGMNLVLVYFMYFFTQVRQRWEDLKTNNPGQAVQLRKDFVLKPKGQRNFQGLVTMTRTVTRTSELALKQKMMEYTRRTYYQRFRGEGYSDDEIAAMWTAATTAEKFQKKLAFKKGKVVWVWAPLPRTASKKDIMAASLSGEQEQLHVGEGTAADMLTGAHGVNIDVGSSGSMFGCLSDKLDGGADYDERDNMVPPIGDKKASKSSSSSSGIGLKTRNECLLSWKSFQVCYLFVRLCVVNEEALKSIQMK